MKSGNSKSKIIQINNQLFFEKSFPQNNQIQFYNEYFIHNYLTNFSKMFTVPLVNKDSKNLKLLYQYMPNTKYLSKVHLIKYLNLIKSIHRSTCNKNRNNLFAKEALINNNICINQIKEKFKNHKQNKLSIDIEKEYKLFIEKLETFFLNRLVPHLEKINPKSSHVFSHADSGIHNCVLDFNNELRLVDLEYSGFDSPIKQHIDFLIHPRNLKGSEIFKDWSNYFVNEKISKDDKPNLNIYNSLFSIKWSLIIISFSGTSI